MNPKRTQRMLRLWLAVQLAASIAANELGAADSMQARIIAPVAPLILFGSIESMLWIPGRRDALGVTRAIVTVLIGAGAAVLSFDSIGRLGALAGLDRFEQAILALIIDGGILVVGMTLLMNRRTVETAAGPPEPIPIPEPIPEPVSSPTPRPAPVPEQLSKPLPSKSEHNLPAVERRDRVAAAAAVGDVDIAALADRFGVHPRTIQRDLENRQAVAA